jgi:hypothetical protein
MLPRIGLVPIIGWHGERSIDRYGAESLLYFSLGSALVGNRGALAP